MIDGVAMSAALVAGLIGSAHCFGMCGGIAGAMGMAAAQNGVRGGRLGLQATLYNVGRITSYVVAGVIVGLLGSALGDMIDLPSWSLWLRGITGLVLLLLGLQIAFGWRLLTFLERGGARLWRRLSPLAGRLLGKRGAINALGLGMLWGWLPCGLSYSMLLVAATTGTAVGGGAIMLAFGLGTLPSMIGASYAGGRIGGLPGGRRTRVIAGLLIALMGIWTAAVPMRHIGSGGHDGHGSMQHEHHAG
ncbi:MAG: sulfite exporter TauE/SafE family protein [Chromatiales bacterium]|nr:sulfite exporter TauE/SafE family protein [Chromatiales bacterium]MDH3931548.1 sulfite exporter TauE/SafE family protein [Chromatiales bacterium]PLX56571.1 MAG: sulfite exporter TauE/SafE family protein [Chromatiales bacterium]